MVIALGCRLRRLPLWSLKSVIFSFFFFFPKLTNRKTWCMLGIKQCWWFSMHLVRHHAPFDTRLGSNLRPQQMCMCLLPWYHGKSVHAIWSGLPCPFQKVRTVICLDPCCQPRHSDSPPRGPYCAVWWVLTCEIWSPNPGCSSCPSCAVWESLCKSSPWHFNPVLILCSCAPRANT